MRRTPVAIVALLVSFLFLLTSCAEMPADRRGATSGAAIGAATGAMAGAIIGGETRSAVMGGLVGALVGGAIGHYGYDQKKGREQTWRDYNYRPDYGTVVTVEEASAWPASVRPGESVELSMRYAILTPPHVGEIEVTETREITLNGSLVGSPEVRVRRADGTYTSTIPLYLPRSAARGTYEVTSTVESDYTRDTKRFTFRVY